MILDLTIHTYGYGDLLLKTLNGIAKFRNSGAYDTLVGFVTVMTGFYCGVNMSCSFSGDGWKLWLRKLLGVVVFIQLAMIPTTTMKVKDHVVWKVPRNVDNIPLAFAIPVGMVESWGYNLTKFFEQSFNWVGSKRINNYTEYGTVFGVKMAKDFSRLKIQNPEVLTSIIGDHGLVKQCIIGRADKNHPFTVEELRDSKNIWKLIRDRTIQNNSGTTKWEKWEKGNRTLHNCTEGVKWMDKVLDNEVKGITSRLLKKWGYSDSHKVNFLKDSVAVFNKATTTDAINIIKHQLILSSIYRARPDASEETDYGVVRGKMQYEASSWISWDMTSSFLTYLLPIFKIIVYVSFIIVFPIFLMVGGIARWRNWILASFALSLWPPLYTILNMVIDYSFDASKIVSYGTLSTVQNQYDMIGAVAATLSVAIIFISTWIIKMGEGGFLQMSSAIMQSMSGGATSAGAEIASGNVSLNNKSIGNENYNNISSDKLNTNFEQFVGENTFNHPDGSRHKVSASGHDSIASGSGINTSSGTRKFDLGSSVEAGIHNGLTKSNTSLTALEKSYNKSKNATISNVAELVSHIAQNESAHNSIDYSKLGEEGKTLREAVTQTKTLHDRDGYGWDQAAQGSLTGYADGGVKISEAVPILHGRAGAKVDLGVGVTNKSNQSLDRETGVSKNYDTDKNLNN
ncbi:MAG: conjugal transfer protein TraG N-terminal domain-containing protein, partial [Rickettsiaceae bacterium]|nr:conjugal transfer protein TraG N-terminal domain-containing protein [Rickettsiaceae bacterium]